MKHSVSLLKRSLSALALAALAACGGGGSSPSGVSTDQDTTSTNQVATFRPEVKPVAASDVVSGSAVVRDGGALQLGLAGMQHVKVGDVLMIEPGVSGLTNAYPGKVVSVTNEAGVTTAVMTRAGIADVFTKLQIDYDSSKNSATQAGLVVRKIITAPGVEAKFEPKPPQIGIQAGIAQTLCGISTQAGLKFVNDLTCDYSKGTLSGELSLQKDIFVTKSESGEKVGATWKAYFKLNDVKQVLQTNFDELDSRLPKKGDHFKAEISGKVSAGVRLQTPDENSKFEWALSDLMGDVTGANLFDDLEWKVKYAELKGLGGEDKAGLLPIAGLVIDAPCVAAAAASGGGAIWKACGFTGALTESRLTTAKPFSFILWAYLRADGTLQLTGSLDIVEMSNLGFESGFDYTFSDGVKKKVNYTESPQLSMLKINGAAHANISVGGEIAADFLIAGIRPAAIHFEAYRYEKDFHAEGSAGFQVYPSFNPSGEICYYGTYEASSRMKVLAQLKAAIGDPDWLQLESGFQWSAEPKHTWNSAPLFEPKCISSQALTYELYRGAQSPLSDIDWTYKLAFKESYNNLRHDIEKWDVVLNGNVVREVFPDENGQISLDLRAGESYTIELRGWHVFEDAEEINGQQPQAIKVRSSQNLATPAMPRIAHTMGNTPAFATVGQQILLWINTAIAGVHTVVWNFTDTTSETIVSALPDLFGKVGAATKTFVADGAYIITATLQDFFGNRVSQDKVNITVVATPNSVEITLAEDDRTTPATGIANNGTTEDATPVIRGAIGAALPSGYEVRVFKNGSTDSFGVATVNGANWAYTVPQNQALAAGNHTFTAAVVLAVDGSSLRSAVSDPYTITVIGDSMFADVTTEVDLPPSALSGSTIQGTVVFTNNTIPGAIASAVVGTVSLSTGDVFSYAVGDLVPGQSVTRTFTTTMPLNVVEVVEATSTVATLTYESNTANNQDVDNQAGGEQTTPNNTPTATFSKLPHTGITANQCYAAGGSTLLACSEPGALALNSQQDGHRANINAMSYSQVGSYPITSCVKDNVTGLIWEGKEASGTRAGGNTYTNYQVGYLGTQAQMDAATNTYGYVAAVNAMALCGFTDWRLPTAVELLGLVNFSQPVPGPMIEWNWFPNTLGSVPLGDGTFLSQAYWSATPNEEHYFYAGAVDFGHGSLDRTRNRSVAMPVRLVRSSHDALTTAERFVFSADGAEVTDRSTGLVWQRCQIGYRWNGRDCAALNVKVYFSHEEALAYSQSVGDWRLPDAKELASLLDPTLVAAGTNQIIFPGRLGMWASTPAGGYPSGFAMMMYGYDGGISGNVRGNTTGIRLVRRSPLR